VLKHFDTEKSVKMPAAFWGLRSVQGTGSSIDKHFNGCRNGHIPVQIFHRFGCVLKTLSQAECGFVTVKLSQPSEAE
jgi:hypothetical protein